MAKGDLPVLVGVGQTVSHWDGTDGPTSAPSPLGLAVSASRAALIDAGLPIDLATLDVIATVRTFEDSIPNAPHPLGHNTNLPGTVARELGVNPSNLIYATVGGQSPQALVHDIAMRIHAGDINSALITGAEALRTVRGAMRHGIELDWSDHDDAPVDDQSMGPPLLNRTEIKHGLVTPPAFYALFENAIAAKRGHTRSAHRHAMSTLFSAFSAIAADNPMAQFPAVRSVDFLATPSPENYPVADPYLKWHIAQDAVNQGAGILLMSESEANTREIAKDKRVYLLGGGEAHEGMVSERENLTRSFAMQTALSRALEQAGLSASDIDLFDLYSCFPCAVYSSTMALGIDPINDPRPLTVTGGLPYFGGPGNNYSLHAIASMAERLRQNRKAIGLVLANGGWMTKEAAGVYSTRRPATFHPVAPSSAASKTISIDDAPESGRIETFTILYGRGGREISHGVAVCRTEDGRQFLAQADRGTLDRFSRENSPIGDIVHVRCDDEVNIIRP